MAAEPDFGTVLSCTNDIASDGRVVTGFRVVAESIVRRWTTPRGRLIGYPDYGLDLTQYVNADMSPRDIAGLVASLAAEAAKDERVSSCDVSATLADEVLTVTAIVNTTKGPFTFVVAASAVSVDLLSVAA